MAKKIVLLSFCVAIAFIVAASLLSTAVDAQGDSSETTSEGTFIDFKTPRAAHHRKRHFQHRRDGCLGGRI